MIASQVRIEPKTFFANERTFIQWFNSSMFIGSAGSTLTSISDAHATGVMLK